MKTKLGMMAACAAMAMAAETGHAQNVIWAGGRAFSLAVGMPCQPARIVTYVPVVVSRPACGWGSGSRSVMAPDYGRPVFHHRPPQVHHRPPQVHHRPAYGQYRPNHGYRGAPPSHGYRW